jgi:hypothetical protein
MSTFAEAEREILVSVENLVGPQASAAIAALAAEKRDEVIVRDHPSNVTTYVDGREGAQLISVKPDGGVIRFEFSYLDEIVRAILDMLVSASPFAPKRPNASPPTHYKEEHAVFLDDVEVLELPQRIPPTSTVVISNLQPYARKVEKGFGPDLKSAHGVYQAVANLAARRYGNMAKIIYTWMQFPGQGPGGPKTRMGGKATHEQDDNFPSIVIKPL